jgi:Fic family protein
VFTFRTTKRAQALLGEIGEISRAIAASPATSASWLARLRGDAAAETIAASVTLAGMPLSGEDARRVIANDRPPTVPPQTAEYALALCDAREFALAQASAEEFTLGLALIRGIHDRAMAPDPSRGYRESREVPEPFAPPPPDEIEWLLGESLAAVNDASVAETPVPVLAALVHAYITAIRPFADGNGRIARVASSAVLCRGGLSAPLFTTLDVWWAKRPEGYRGLLAKLGTEWNPNADVSAFVDGYLKALAAHAQATVKDSRAPQRIWALLETTVTTDLSANPRATNALFDAFLGRDITGSSYQRTADVTESLANHDLGKLAGVGLLQLKGAGRLARYIGTPALYELVVHSAGLDQRWLLPSGSAGKRRDAVLAGLAEGGGDLGDVRD